MTLRLLNRKVAELYKQNIIAIPVGTWKAMLLKSMLLKTLTKSFRNRTLLVTMQENVLFISRQKKCRYILTLS